MLVDVKCKSCAADLSYEPGTTSLICNHCQFEVEIEQPLTVKEAHHEVDLESYLNNFDACQEKIESRMIQCESCGATTEFGSDVKATHCAFCDTPLVLSRAENTKRIKPQGIIPFQIKREQAISNFSSWVKGLWLAPHNLKKHAEKLDRFQGVYIPYWTYDCNVATSYTGKKGVNYKESVTVTNSDGKTETRTETRTRWYFASGHVTNNFDDVLVPATYSLDTTQLHQLEPWDLSKLVDYTDSYLQGYQAELYQVNLKEGYADAKVRMQEKIETTIDRDIGGDKQIISTRDSTYTDATFKHLILPVWVSSYRYREKVYRVLVNAQTGEVTGERPYCPFKVTFMATLVLTVSIGIAVIYHRMEY
ncbi:hypothetical protein RJD38_01310 [Vibrio scophthalmi]|uniref:Primosomal protein N' (Replication factor Y)-superfamily II helicase n=2 Tax=Vibrio scophthalmi TaxID=45658 RepID=F9RTA1_9VIBR|nr:hypothetical protein [Vibrio scophthalmi]ANU35985.1 hypothetical protein VSVS05_00854 [Vibrio scophthalmi]EGU31339.1 hypothetical protein VIS19158_14577 [Vibrio scophthalmi LMG 19158]